MYCLLLVKDNILMVNPNMMIKLDDKCSKEG